MCSVFFPFILGIKLVGRTSRGHTGGRSHRISHPLSFCGACLDFSREKDSAIPFPRRPWSRILCTNDFIVLHPLGIFIFVFLVFWWEKSRLPGSNSRPNVSEGYEVPLSYRPIVKEVRNTSTINSTELRIRPRSRKMLSLWYAYYNDSQFIEREKENKVDQDRMGKVPRLLPHSTSQPMFHLINLCTISPPDWIISQKFYMRS